MSAVIQVLAVGDTEEEAADAFREFLVTYLSVLRRFGHYSDDDASCERLLAGLRRL